MLRLRHPDFRMRDNEIALRYIAFALNLQHYNGNLKDLLDRTTAELNSSWSDIEQRVSQLFRKLERAIAVTQEIFQADAFKKWNGYFFESRVNRAVFDVIAYYFSDERVIGPAVDNKESVVNAFKEACSDWRFATSISGTTKSLESVHFRFSIWATRLSAAIGVPITSPV
jgi:hypothetical protein